MKLTLKRSHRQNDATIGMLYKDGDTFLGFTLEDLPNEAKVEGETRIPAGTYQIKQREVLSGLTQRYRDKYPWFDWHLELQGVPDFNYIYIHIGNYAKNTEGCILLASSYKWGQSMVRDSTTRFKMVYEDIRATLNSGEDVYITVLDEYE